MPEDSQLITALKSPVLRVIGTYLWFFISPALGVLFVVFGLHMDLAAVRDTYQNYSVVVTIIEFMAYGLIPVALFFLCRDSPGDYGIRKKGLGSSLMFSLAFAGSILLIHLIATGSPVPAYVQAYHSPFPLNVVNAILGFVVHGPVEVFFVLWLIENTDQALKNEEKTSAMGLLITVAVFGAMHIITTGDITNAARVLVGFLVLGAIYKFTGNSLGPMIGWTLINGQAWHYLI